MTQSGTIPIKPNLEPERTLNEYALPTLDVIRGNIERLVINANNFKIKIVTIQMIQNTLQLWGNMMEDLN
ncbi:hypothetical protein EPI10_001906 [Gossypium australe]|uniref:Uncharacterized protein n=1 Tax=Gossypium australe TaxID=47621 RepID=A0A5B6VCF5_9ROSI|nr:hypothetical protein EPI10_001906 [Gossypium australe]